MSSRIGETASFIETYLCEQENNNTRRSVDIFFLEDKICNAELIKLYSKLINISPFAKITRDVARANKLFNDSHLFEIKRNLLKNLPLFSSREPYLSFDQDQHKLGKSLLKDIGLPENAKYICFSARDDAYLNEIHPDRDWSYHNYRDVNIQNYLFAIEELVNLGYYVIRVGSIVKNKLETTNDCIIDYSSSNLRSEFLDLYLLANCKFFIGDTSGLKIIPQVFRKPCVVLNLVGRCDAVGYTLPEDLILFKKIWDTEKKSYFSLKDLRDIDNYYYRSEYYINNGLELIENTPDEICSVVLEMVARINGNIEYSVEDECLQDKFKAQFLAGFDTDCVGRLGRDYLRQNHTLFLCERTEKLTSSSTSELKTWE